jgi:hypothetical protein
VRELLRLEGDRAVDVHVAAQCIDPSPLGTYPRNERVVLSIVAFCGSLAPHQVVQVACHWLRAGGPCGDALGFCGALMTEEMHKACGEPGDAAQSLQVACGVVRAAAGAWCGMCLGIDGSVLVGAAHASTAWDGVYGVLGYRGWRKRVVGDGSCVPCPPPAGVVGLACAVLWCSVPGAAGCHLRGVVWQCAARGGTGIEGGSPVGLLGVVCGGMREVVWRGRVCGGVCAAGECACVCRLGRGRMVLWRARHR